MRRVFGTTLAELGSKDNNVLALYGDVYWPKAENDFEDLFKERLYNFGIREQAMISAAAGLALEGHIPFVYSLTPFLLKRAYEQIALDVNLHKAPVILVGYADYPGEGPTQNMSNEEIEILFKNNPDLENITLFLPKDTQETIYAIKQAYFLAKMGKPSFISLKKDHKI